MKGYEEVKIPPTPTAPLKANEKLVHPCVTLRLLVQVFFN